MAVTDQFLGISSDRYAEVAKIFGSLKDGYERAYYTGLLNERRAKVQLRAGRSAHTLLPLLEEALRCFAEAERLRPQSNDDSILRWNSCVRLLESRPDFYEEESFAATSSFGTEDTPPA